MKNLFNQKVLNLIPIIFMLIIVFRILYNYNALVKKEEHFAQTEAEVLNEYVITHRNYYQNFFIDKTIPLNANTLVALPAHSSRGISHQFSKNNLLNITVRTVSDRARNPLNTADEDELKAIEFFKHNTNETQYFSSQNKQYYQFASVLKIEQKCLTCHGSKQSAPQFIQNQYDKAYGYKIGDVRGLISIKVPVNAVRSYFMSSFIESIIHDLLLLIVLFFAISYLTKKSKTINSILLKEIKEKTNELKKTYLTDKLTALPNRRQLLEDIKDKGHLALLNIDSFKDINDFYGHTSGDKILKDLTEIFKETYKNSDFKIYKLPSDEFAIYADSHISQNDFIHSVNTLMEIIQKRVFTINDNNIFIIMSCGVASNMKHLFSMADIALKSAKNTTHKLIVYDQSLDISQKMIANTTSLAVLKDAITHDQIVPFFQPIYNLSTKKIEKYESLVRIVQKDGTVVLPYQFLDTAIRSKQYTHITKIMIQKSFEFFKDNEYEFSINLSVIDMSNADTLKYIIDALQEFKQPQRVVFEILENDKLGSYEEIKKFIKVIKAFGCKFAIDDFGSGYSNFSHVHELNVDYLKIDASLVKSILTDKNSYIITKTIIDFASNIGLKTIAEYVEDKESLEMLREMGADYIQGYYIGKPEATLQER